MNISKIWTVLGLVLLISACVKESKPPETTSNAAEEVMSETNVELTLTEQLKKKADESAQKSPSEKRKIMFAAIDELRKSKTMETALKEGAKIPHFKLEDVHGKEISSKEILQNGPMLLVFYRGGWCPYCNLQLRDLQEHLAEIKETGAQLVAISPQEPDSSAETVKKNELGYHVLSDVGGKVGNDFGLMFKLPEDLIKVYKEFGLDLEKANGNKDWELPLAATYIVKTDGTIEYAFVDADYKKRAETNELIEKLKAL